MMFILVLLPLFYWLSIDIQIAVILKWDILTNDVISGTNT